MSVTVREASLDDAERIVEYLVRLLNGPGHNSPYEPGEFQRTADEQRRLLAEHAAEPNSVYLLAVDDGRMVGELTCRGYRRRALSHVTLLGMSVASDCRGRGVGARLMEAMIEWATRGGVVRRIELFVYPTNAAAIRLYERYGFELEGRRRRIIRQGDDYLDDLLMARLL